MHSMRPTLNTNIYFTSSLSLFLSFELTEIMLNTSFVSAQIRMPNGNHVHNNFEKRAPKNKWLMCSVCSTAISHTQTLTGKQTVQLAFDRDMLEGGKKINKENIECKTRIKQIDRYRIIGVGYARPESGQLSATAVDRLAQVD